MALIKIDMANTDLTGEIYDLLSEYLADKHINEKVSPSKEEMGEALNWFLEKFYENSEDDEE